MFSSGAQTAGTTQAIAAALVPGGLTPVAFFPPRPDQQMQAISVIFSEPLLQRRKLRSVKQGRRRHHYRDNISYNFKGVLLYTKIIITVTLN